MMENELNPEKDASPAIIYQIKIKGHLDNAWEGFSITLEYTGNTVLTGPVADQAALHGLLKKVRDLGMPLLSVNRVDPIK